MLCLINYQLSVFNPKTTTKVVLFVSYELFNLHEMQPFPLGNQNSGVLLFTV